MSVRAVKAAELTRTDGDTNVQPDGETAAAMVAAGRTRVISSWAIAIDAAGWVEQVAAITSTGFVAYDVRIAEALRGWRFQPFRDADGMAIPVATTYTFVWTP
jgi:hypothetical protein